MASKGYTLEQTGPQVQTAINKIINLSPATTESAGLMSSSDKRKLDGLEDQLSGKVNKIPGKGLSTNDYDDTEKAKVASAYQKPVTGIPESDLSDNVRESLGKADTAMQSEDLDPITEKIPAQASAQNQLADKAFVNSSISTATADFKGTYDSLSELQAVTADKNDYGYVVSTDEAGNTIYSRYKYNGSSWVFEYDLNNSSFTAAEWASIQSQITAALVQKLSALPTNQELSQSLSGKQDIIPDLSTIRSGANAGATAYQKPASGIPASDLAEGVIPEAQTDLVKYSTQSLTDAQKMQARTNIGAASEEEFDAISRGEYVEAWDGASAPVVAEIPSGVQVEYNSQTYTGTLAASNDTLGKIYLVGTGSTDEYNRYRTSRSGVEGSYTYSWVPFGSTQMNLSSYATKNEVSQLQQKVDENVISSALDGCKGYKSEHAGVNTMTTIATFNLKAGVKYQLRVKASSATPSGYVLVNRVYKADGTTKLMTASLSSGQTESISPVYDCQEDLNGCIFKSETMSNFEWEIIVSEFLADNAVITPKIADNAVTSAKIADNAITTQKIADNAVAISKVSDYTKDALLDGFLSGSNKDYNPYVKECYIDPTYLANGVITMVALRVYRNGNGMIVRAFEGSESSKTARWSMVNSTILNGKNNGDIIPIVVTTAGAGVVVGTTVGYIIFSDIAGFKAQGSDSGDGQKFVLGLCTKLFTQYNIYDYLKKVPGNVLPDGAVTEQKIANGAVSLQKTTGVSPYEGVYISVPDNITAVVGDKIQIFFKSIVNCADISAFDVIAVCSKGKSYPRYWEYTPVAGDAGNTTTITFRVRDNARNTIVEKSATISFVNKMTAPGTNKNVLCIGASATANGVWVGELKRRLTENTGDGTPANPTGLGLSNITFVGRKQGSVVNVSLEATGGWKVQTYASQGETAFRLQVSGVTQLHIGDQYTSPNGGGVFVLQEINVTEGVGNLRFTFNSAVPTIPESGTLTRTSGTGDSTITYSSYEQESYSPFWNTDTDKLDFAKYANDWCNGTIDVMIWHCGVNDIFDGSTASITSAVNAFKDILRQFHIDFPSGKVIISSVPTCSQNGGMAANYGASSYANTFTFSNSARQYALALSALCADAEFSSFAFYAPVLEEFDAENNYPSTDTPVNNRLTSVTEKVGTNGVHPLNAGSLQVADCVYRTFNTI